MIEFFRVVFGGWPVLGFLFLVLFYSPLRKALDAIPAKVVAAEEIGVLGVSLKSTIQTQAARLGSASLSEKIPELSSAAIELLFWAPGATTSITSYSPGERREYLSIDFPTPGTLQAVSELHSAGLIELETDGGVEASELIDDFKRNHAGREEPSRKDGYITWTPDTPLPRDTRLPMLNWKLTELGRKAIEVIIKAVSTELNT